MQTLLDKQEQDAAAIEKLTLDYRVSSGSGVLNPMALFKYNITCLQPAARIQNPACQKPLSY